MATYIPRPRPVRYHSQRYYRIRTIVRIVFWVALTSAFLILVGIVGRAEFYRTLPHCTSEDSLQNCYWDGGENGLGAKFYVLNGEVHYVG